jgi:hypothetical protein
MLRSGGHRLGATLQVPDRNEFIERDGTKSWAPSPYLSDFRSTSSLVFGMVRAGWSSDQMHQALSDEANRGGAYYRWVANQEKFLARAVESATAFVGVTYTKKKPKAKAKASSGEFTPPNWAVRVLYDRIKARPETSVRQIRALPEFAAVRYRNWFVDKLVAWCTERGFLTRNAPKGRSITHTAQPLPGLTCIVGGQETHVEALTATDPSLGARLARRAAQKAASREYDGILAPYLADQHKRYLRSLRSWFARNKGKTPTKKTLAPESIRTELASLHTELEATRSLWVSSLLQLDDTSTYSKAMSELQAGIDRILAFCSEYGLALDPSELKPDTPPVFNVSSLMTGTHFEQYTDLDPALVSDIFARMA